ncbi:DUF3579 domain-containing protein [Acidihalobacter prosperus]
MQPQQPAQYTGKGIVSGYINGAKFRPSNWSERVAESAGHVHGNSKRFEYSDYLAPIYHHIYGHCLRVDFDSLRDNSPETYRYLLWFIESNGLEVVKEDTSE